ncbi:MAG: hypothetical protein KAH38_13430 [Candidatus Hydrogenedentes bacterium]|nr:hypothetical protein [Candidatus Hydrogenedentota bacterium]
MNKRSALWISLVLTVCLGLVTSGCETYGQAGGLGAGLGAVAGGIIGAQSGHALEGAAIGGVIGGVGGLIAHDIKARRMRSKAETETAYNYTPVQGEMLTLERTEVLPATVRPGEMADASIQYALLGAAAGIQVSEQRSLKQGDRMIADISTHNFTRDDGTWVSSQPIRLPSNLNPGQYTIVTTVRTSRSAISSQAQFTVL